MSRSILILTILLACTDKSVDDGGYCAYDWTGAPCSTEWEGLYNCDECTQSYRCEPADAPWPLGWAPASVSCECVNLETGALLTSKAGCEDAGESAAR